MSTPSLYAPREPIFPRRVSGTFRRLKWWILALTLGIYYITPWLRWDRGPGMPDQAVLVDLANRRFYFFWIEIWPHEFYFVAGLLIMAGLGLFLFTSALGRVWCGYTCPQTVWTDLFILVERWIEGDRNARVRLHNAKWSAHKAWLRSVKWTVWLAIALATGGAWVFYFTDAPALLGNLLNGTAHPAAYITIAILTATTFVFGGFMREQVCIYMCPWPRIQSAMMDPDTLTVAYRDWRGEPRGKGKRTDPNVPNTHVPDLAQALHAGTDPVATKGDCIDCMACVNVCPMGIDIRDGQQMECITCALCIDACDDVMDRIGKPRGLIDYMALTDEPRERAGLPPRPIWQHILRPRTIIYTLLWSAIGVGLVYALFIRSPIELTVSPVRNPTYVVQSDGAIRNIYDVRLRNKSLSEAEFRLSLTADTVLRIDLEGNADRDVIVTVPADTSLTQRVYVTARASDPAATAHDTALRFWVEDASTGDRASQATTFNGRVQ
ncbi:cytochrome c oxidase accessory protein CcoG [Loktanella salsilacus]|jgi:cytochrome c oxidase accessory protein FixG|uniref:Cytochrome c oxidase accessory protein FixG n=1 Tax=Loktanella salsilacus TaxID=195913 RepID=A0A1I4DRJ9_9RHOB|nr:cytochrome c oxidase accessory protein CcoG [Loktanella salsilacus]UTH43710.1 cytochrome c oxidase accessory protein CcoG [Loktanella salsilacus]SFK96308.1 cytochrome c oxidase accessory protein FixG [Loktanella salsilacus]